MTTACDVAQYILEKYSEVSAIKLQKLVYYCQAWTLAWDGRPLFEDEIQAWANGPVTPNLYDKHRHQLVVRAEQKVGDSAQLSPSDVENIEIVMSTYGDKPPFWLVELTHLEQPWKDARGDCPPGHICTNIIPHAAMAEYYSGLIR